MSDNCPSPEDAERARHRLALVALLDDRAGQRVIAGLAVRPQLLDRRHHQRKQRRQQLLQQVADEEVLLARLADDGRRVDRVACDARSAARRTPGSRAAASSSRSDRRTVLRAVRTSGATCPISANSAFAISGCGWPLGPATCGRRSPAISDASISSGTFSGSGAIADRISAGGPPRNTVSGSGFVARLGARVVKAAALADLPVHARSMRGRRPACDTCRGCAPASRDAACRPAGTSQTARHRPASDVMTGSRSSRTSDVTTSRTGPVGQPAGADLQQVESDVARAPQLRRRRRQHGLGQMHDALDELRAAACRTRARRGARCRTGS